MVQSDGLSQTRKLTYLLRPGLSRRTLARRDPAAGVHRGHDAPPERPLFRAVRDAAQPCPDEHDDLHAQQQSGRLSLHRRADREAGRRRRHRDAAGADTRLHRRVGPRHRSLGIGFFRLHRPGQFDQLHGLRPRDAAVRGRSPSIRPSCWILRGRSATRCGPASRSGRSRSTASAAAGTTRSMARPTASIPSKYGRPAARRLMHPWTLRTFFSDTNRHEEREQGRKGERENNEISLSLLLPFSPACQATNIET